MGASGSRTSYNAVPDDFYTSSGHQDHIRHLNYRLRYDHRHLLVRVGSSAEREQAKVGKVSSWIVRWNIMLHVLGYIHINIAIRCPRCLWYITASNLAVFAIVQTILVSVNLNSLAAYNFSAFMLLNVFLFFLSARKILGLDGISYMFIAQYLWPHIGNDVYNQMETAQSSPEPSPVSNFTYKSLFHENTRSNSTSCIPHYVFRSSIQRIHNDRLDTILEEEEEEVATYTGCDSPSSLDIAFEDDDASEYVEEQSMVAHGPMYNPLHGEKRKTMCALEIEGEKVLYTVKGDPCNPWSDDRLLFLRTQFARLTRRVMAAGLLGFLLQVTAQYFFESSSLGPEWAAILGITSTLALLLGNVACLVCFYNDRLSGILSPSLYCSC